MKLGVTDENSSFFKALVSVEALKAGLGTLISKVQEFRNWMVQGTVDAGYEAQLYASRLGLTVDQTQRLAYVSRMANVTLEEMTHATRALAAKGITDINGALLNLADTFAKMPDNGRKLAMAQEYLGRYGTKFIPVLNRGRAAMEGLMQEAEDMGVVMSGPALEATRQYGEEQRRLQASLEGLRNTVMLPLIPVLTRTLERWIRLVHVLRDFAKNTQEMLARLRTLITMVGLAGLAWVGYTVVQYVALTATILETSALSAMAIMLWNVTTAALAAVAPWLAWAAAITAVYLLIDDIVVFFMNGDSLIGRALKKWIGPFDTWQEALKIVWGKVKTEFEHLWDEMKTVATNAIAKLPGMGLLADAQYLVTGKYNGGVSQLFGGGAASPAAAAGISSRTVNAPNTVTIQNLNVHGGSGSPSDVADAVHRKISEHMKSEYRGAAAAAAGP